MTDHESGAKEQAEEDRAAGGPAANVVPFPRSWYGSVDELVPIDPQPPRAARSSDTVADANAFWAGDTTRARGDQGAGSPSGKTSPPHQVVPEWDEDEIELSLGPSAPTGDVAPEPGGPQGAVPSSARQRDTSQRPPRRLPIVVAVALVALLVGIISAAALDGGGRGRNHAATGIAARRPALTVTQTVPQTTTVVQTVTTSGGRPVRHRPVKRSRATHAVGAPRQVDTTVRQPATTSVQETTAAPSAGYYPSSSSPRPSDSSRGNATPRVGSGRTPASSGSSHTGCAPSATNGGACSL